MLCLLCQHMGRTSEMAGKQVVSGWMVVEQKNKKFQYPEVVGNNFMYRHSVHDHNNK